MSQIKEYGKVAITFEGEFDQNKSYEKLCIVEYGGMSFLSKVNGTTSIPTQNKDEWIQLSVPGEKGEKGDVGDKGDKGDKGDIGLKGISTRTIFVYKHSETVPDKPIGGSVDFVGGAIIFPEGWQASDNISSPVWRSERTFFEDDSIQDDWSTPMKMTGDDGKAGVDGVNMEFIYKVTKRPTIVPDISNMPSENVNDYVPVEFGWSDSPHGVTAINRIEWICTRKKVNGVWTKWEGPTIWSAYGEKGQDGDGVEYIYFIDKSGFPPSNPTPEDWEYNDEYQNTEIEYVPKDLGWKDEPTGVSDEFKFEWQSQRKIRNGIWQPFTDPTLWSKYGDKGNIGDRIVEMFAKTKSSSEPPIVVNDEDAQTNPGSVWSMIPQVYDQSKGEVIWKTFTYLNYKHEWVEWESKDENGEIIKHIGWSNPVLFSGLNGQDAIPANYWVYIYKRQDEGSPEIPTFTDPTQFEQAGWNDIPYVDTNNDGVVDIQGIWWECAGLVNGVDETVEWKTLRQINSSTTKTLFAVNNSSTIAPSVNTNVRNPEGWSETYNKPNIYEFVWQITAEVNAQDQLIGEWQGPVCISREHIEINDEGNINIGGEDTGVNVLNLHLELDNDSETIPTNSEGNTIGTVSAITTAQLYNGNKLITEGVTYSAVATKCTLKETENTTGIFEVVALDSGTDVIGYYVEITATYKNIEISKKFNISKSLGTKIYKLVVDRNIVNIDEENKNIFFYIKYIDFEGEHRVTNLIDERLSVYLNDVLLWSYDYTANSGLTVEINKTSVIKVTSFGNINEVKDSETIGVVNNGTSINIKGSLNSINELPNTPNSESDCYIIGLDIYCWDSTKGEWFNAGQFKGVDGKAPQISNDGYWMFWNGNEYEKTEFYAIGDGHLPYIKDGYWWEWDKATKSYKNTGFAAKGDNGTSYYMHTAYSNNSDGTGFVYGPNVVTDYDYIGIYTGIEADQSKLVKTDYKWTKHRGTQGIDGIHGVSIYIRYQIGNDIKPKVSVLPSEVTGVSNYWTETIPNVTEDYPYIWCTQGKKVYTSQKEYYYSWSEPFRLSGTNGLDGIGDKGDPGKIIYPAGIYANNVTYQATDKKAPYVWDPSYGAYYVYLSTTPWKGTEQNNLTPGREYNANKDSGTNKWELFEQFEAVYAKIGIIANGLIGSAVFNGDYMFSQQGYTTLTGNTPADGKSYENFNPDDPFGSNNSFYPNICFNFKTGAVWIGRNKFVVDNEGNIKLGKFNITSKGLEYKLTIDGDDSLFSINEEGILLTQAGDIIYELNSNGNVKFVNENILFNKDGTWQIGNKIKYDGNKLSLVNIFDIYNDGNIINKNIHFYDLVNDISNNISNSDIIKISDRNYYYCNDFIYYSSKYYNSSNIISFSGFNIEIGQSFVVNKRIKIAFKGWTSLSKTITFSLVPYNSGSYYNIINTTIVSGTDWISQTSMVAQWGKEYEFVAIYNNGPAWFLLSVKNISD